MKSFESKKNKSFGKLLYYMIYVEFFIFLHSCQLFCEFKTLYLLSFIAHIVCVVDPTGKKTLQH